MVLVGTITPPDEAAIARLTRTPFYNAQLRTTCVATMLSGGHAPNALPQEAKANVNCRRLPGLATDSLVRMLTRVIGDTTVTQQRQAVGKLGGEGEIVHGRHDGEARFPAQLVDEVEHVELVDPTGQPIDRTVILGDAHDHDHDHDHDHEH
mgnify:CR=1 FL=1